MKRSEKIPYTLIRSSRRTVAAEVTRTGELIIRAPRRMPVSVIEDFLRKHSGWIAEKQARQRTLAEKYPEPDAAEEAALRARAKDYLPRRTAYYAALMGLQPAWVKITSAKKRFGSCGPENGICYAWRLMRYPEAAIDYVVVHELAHIVHKNHSRAFYGLIERYLPDWRERAALLKE